LRDIETACSRVRGCRESTLDPGPGVAVAVDGDLDLVVRIEDDGLREHDLEREHPRLVPIDGDFLEVRPSGNYRRRGERGGDRDRDRRARHVRAWDAWARRGCNLALKRRSRART
jgi:hypothetical protein